MPFIDDIYTVMLNLYNFFGLFLLAYFPILLIHKLDDYTHAHSIFVPKFSHALDFAHLVANTYLLLIYCIIHLHDPPMLDFRL